MQNHNQIADENFLKQIQQLSSNIVKQLQTIKQFEHTQLFKKKVQQFISDYTKKSSTLQASHLNEPIKLKLKFKTDPKQQEDKPVNTEEKQKSKKIKLSDPNIFIYSFQLPCSYDYYQKMIRSEQIQKKADQIINTYQVLKQIYSDPRITIQLMYLTYKRVLIIAPRQFIYIRIFYKQASSSEEQPTSTSTNCILTFSIPYQTQTQKTRAQIILTAQKIQQFKQNNQNRIKVNVYSQIDMKTAVKAQMAKSKGFVEIRKYIMKLYEFCKQEKKME